jgi:hypothetical protein
MHRTAKYAMLAALALPLAACSATGTTAQTRSAPTPTPTPTPTATPCHLVGNATGGGWCEGDVTEPTETPTPTAATAAAGDNAATLRAVEQKLITDALAGKVAAASADADADGCNVQAADIAGMTSAELKALIGQDTITGVAITPDGTTGTVYTSVTPTGQTFTYGNGRWTRTGC